MATHWRVNANMKYGEEDWDFWMTILKTGKKVVTLPEMHFYYQIRKIRLPDR